MIKIQLPEPVRAVICRLEASGHEAYTVGGCVRDSIMGREPHDWDVATSCPPNEMMKLFDVPGEFSVFPTGLKHGTVTAVYNNTPVEVTTYRRDGEYEDHRSPKKVSFGESIEGDLARRDFTVNAMAYSEKRGLVDIYGGLADIEKKVIRCVGDPHVRFYEDALRIMRAMRFASTLCFSVDHDTRRAAEINRDLLSYVSAERVTSELAKLIDGERAASVMREFFAVICRVIPNVSEFKLVSGIGMMEKLAEASFYSKLAALLTAFDKKEMKAFFDAMRFENKTRERVKRIMGSKFNAFKDKTAVKMLCSAGDAEYARDVIELSIAFGFSEPEAREILHEVLTGGECYCLADLKIKGDDILSLGISPRKIGGVLEELLLIVISEPHKNDRDTLMEAARSLC